MNINKEEHKHLGLVGVNFPSPQLAKNNTWDLRWSINKNYKDKIQDRTHPLIPVIETVLATCANSIPTSPGKHCEINSYRTRNTQDSGRERLR